MDGRWAPPPMAEHWTFLVCSSGTARGNAKTSPLVNGHEKCHPCDRSNNRMVQGPDMAMRLHKPASDRSAKVDAHGACDDEGRRLSEG